MRRPLNVTATGDLGLEHGKVVWMDEDEVHVLLRTRMPRGAVRRVRLDLGHVGRQVDLEIKVVQVQSGKGTLFKGGHVHQCGFRLFDAADASALDQCLSTLNPAAGSVSPSTWSTLSTRHDPPAHSSPSPSQTASAAPRSGRARVVRAIQRSTRKRREMPPPRNRRAAPQSRPTPERKRTRKRKRRRPAESQAGSGTPSSASPSSAPPSSVVSNVEAPPPEPSILSEDTVTDDGLLVVPPALVAELAPERRTRIPIERAPRTRQGVTEDLLVTPLWSPGPPPSLFAVFENALALACAFDEHETGARFVLAAVGPVEVGDVIELVLQLPDGSMAQLIAMIQRRGDERIWIDVQFMPPETLALLHTWI